MPLRILVFVLAALALLPACDSGSTTEEGPGLMGYFETKSRFRPFAELLISSGVENLIQPNAGVTILSPTDIAVESVGSDFLAVLQERRSVDVLRRVLRTHIISGVLRPEDFVDGATLTSIDGLPLPVRRIGAVVLVAGSRLDLSGAIEREGNVAYPAGTVLLRALPATERIGLSPSLTRFQSELENSGVLSQVPSAPRTIIAPLNDAYINLGESAQRLTLSGNTDIRPRVMRSHVIPGTPDLADGAVWTALGGDALRITSDGAIRTIGGQRVLRDETTADGRLIVLEGVILAPLNISQRTRLDPLLDEFIADVRLRLPSVWTQLGDDGAGPFTIFAPSDFAYAARSEAVSATLQEPEAAALRRRLLNVHVFEGVLEPGDLSDGQVITSIDGQDLQVTRSGTAVFVQGVPIGLPVRTANGNVFTLPRFLPPVVDALDGALLGDYTTHVRSVWRTGLESVFRTPGLTAFIATNDQYAAYPTLTTDLDSLRMFLRFNASFQTISTIPRDSRISFTALDGSPRSVGEVLPEVCVPEPEDPCPPPEPSYLGLEDRVPVVQGVLARDGSGITHYFFSPRLLSFPPDGGGALARRRR